MIRVRIPKLAGHLGRSGLAVSSSARWQFSGRWCHVLADRSTLLDLANVITDRAANDQQKLEARRGSRTILRAVAREAS